MTFTVDDMPKRLALSGITNAAGVCTIPFRVQGQGGWQVEQVTIEMRGAPSGAAAFLRVNDVLITDMIAIADAAGGDPPLPLFSGDVGEIEWTGATPGDIGKALLIYRTASYAR